ncbi:MAG: ATP-binding protein [Oscillospiraceae bacterium]|nr:ATP-binding protein [Oscillospiraceae bacterium]
MKTVTTIVITGGPCSGKTSALERIRDIYTQRGFTAIFVPETATEMMTGGLYPWNCGGNVNFQRCLMELQQTKERMFRRAALTMEGEHVLVFCDRAAFDNRAYMTEEEFRWILQDLGTDEDTLLHSYDAVFHMTSVASGDDDLYSRATNITRYEDREGAAKLDKITMEGWKNHPYFRVIPLQDTFEEKVDILVRELDAFLMSKVSGNS